MLSRRVTALFLVAPLLAAATAACGDAKRLQPTAKAVKVSLPAVQATINPAPPPSSSSAPPATASSAAPSGTASSAGSGAGASAAPGGANEVKTSAEFKFMPAALQIKAGTEVTFTNAGGGPHSVTGGDGTPDASSPIGNNPLEAEGATVKVKFDKPGTYPFFCIPHQTLGMKGQIVVS